MTPIYDVNEADRQSEKMVPGLLKKYPTEARLREAFDKHRSDQARLGDARRCHGESQMAIKGQAFRIALDHFVDAPDMV